MRLTDLAEEKARELLEEYRAKLHEMTPAQIAQLAFMRGVIHGTVTVERMIDEAIEKAKAKEAAAAALAIEKPKLDTSLNIALDLLARRGEAGSPHS